MPFSHTDHRSNFCIVHLIRHSMDFASWKDRKSLAQALLRTVYCAADAAAGQAALDAFAQGPVGRKISGHCAELASQLGARDSVLRFSARRAADPSTPRMLSRR